MNKRDKKNFSLQSSSTGTLAHVNEKGGGEGGIVMFYFDEKRRVE